MENAIKHFPRSHFKNSTSLITVVYLQQGFATQWLKLSDPPEGTHDGAGGAPLAIPPVLPGAEEVLPAPVVGVLVEDPVAVHDVTGVDVAVVEAVGHTGTVVHEFHHVAAEVGLLVDPHPVGAAILRRQQGKTPQQ